MYPENLGRTVIMLNHKLGIWPLYNTWNARASQMPDISFPRAKRTAKSLNFMGNRSYLYILVTIKLEQITTRYFPSLCLSGSLPKAKFQKEKRTHQTGKSLI